MPAHAEALTASQVFMMLFDVKLVASIVFETNKYAKQTQSKQKSSAPSRWNDAKTFKPTTAAEMYCFFGVCVAMSLGPKMDYKKYWSDVCTGGYVPPQLGRIMKRHMFEDIKRFLHFTDNEVLIPPGAPGYSKLGKLGPTVEALTNNSINFFRIGSYTNIDEAMVGGKHRSHLRQFIKNKPDKYGFKLWCLNCSRTGYF